MRRWDFWRWWPGVYGSGFYLWDVLKYNYEETNSEACIDGFWKGNYNAIANCNQILAHVDEQKGVFSSGVYEAVKAEAMALRAFLHFDLLGGLLLPMGLVRMNLPFHT